MLYSGDDYYGDEITSPLERPAALRVVDTDDGPTFRSVTDDCESIVTLAGMERRAAERGTPNARVLVWARTAEVGEQYLGALAVWKRVK